MPRDFGTISGARDATESVKNARSDTISTPKETVSPWDQIHSVSQPTKTEPVTFALSEQSDKRTEDVKRSQINAENGTRRACVPPVTEDTSY